MIGKELSLNGAFVGFVCGFSWRRSVSCRGFARQRTTAHFSGAASDRWHARGERAASSHVGNPRRMSAPACRVNAEHLGDMTHSLFRVSFALGPSL